MAKLTRVTGKVFGGSASLAEIGQFGSAKAGTPTNTQDVATIQSLSAYDEGWGSAVVTTKNFPPIEEVTGALKTISYQACYLLQEGAPEYDIGTEYSNTSIVKSISGDELSFYISLQNGNIGNALSNTSYWVKALSLVSWSNATSSNISLTSVTAVGSYNVDLSGTLPSDGKDYECVFRYFIERRDNSANDSSYKITSAGGKVWAWDHVEGDPQLATNYVRKSGQFTAIVGSERKIVLEIAENALNNSSLDLLMYKRCAV